MSNSHISVAIRSRPLLEDELQAAEPLEFHSSYVKTANTTYNYDYVFPPPITNEAVYNLAVADKIPHLFNGYNVTILAYGSTGSGKTYTMGTDYNPRNISNSDIGIIPRGLSEIFRVLDSEKDTKDFSVKVSFLELYREIIYDLLTETSSSCTLREDIDGKFKVLNLTEVPVNSITAAFDILAKGSRIRHTSATAKNAQSSRSHAIFSVYVEQTEKETLTSIRAKFQLVDLAGSERMSTSKTGGVRMKEGININLGLLSLGKVIYALSEEKPHIPYRESKLTRLLQDSLGGNSYTVMIACINPSFTSAEETQSTLRYASNTRRIKNRPVVNIESPATQIARLQKQVDSLTYANKQLQSSLPMDNASARQLQATLSEIEKLNDKLLKFEETNCHIIENLKLFYEEIKIIVADIIIAVGSDSSLQSHLEKLELIQSECLQLIEERNLIHSIEADEHSLQLNKISDDADESSESVLPLKTDLESTDGAESLSSQEKEEITSEIYDSIASVKYLNNVSRTLEMKEVMARHIQDILKGYETCDEERDHDLKKQLQILTQEKNDLQVAMKKSEETFVQEMQEKVDKYEVQIQNLQDQLRKNTKSMQMKQENLVKMEVLQREIKDLKSTKVQIMKQMKDNTNKHVRIQRQKDKEIVKLERESRKKDVEFSKMKTKFANQMRVLQTKVSQATASKNKLLHTLQKNKAGQTGVKPKPSQEGLEEWMEEQLKNVIGNEVVKLEVEALEKEADILKDQIKKIAQLSPTAEIDNPQLSAAEQLKADLQVILEQIAEMRLQTKEDRAKPCNILTGIVDLSEAKSALEYLLKRCASAIVEVEKQGIIIGENNRAQQSKDESNEEKIISLTNEIKSLKDEMYKYKEEQERNTFALKWEHDSKLLHYMAELQSANNSSLTEEVDQSMAKRIKMQGIELERMQSLRLKYKEKCDEIDRLHEVFFQVKKGNRSNWLSDLTNNSEPSTSKQASKDATMMEGYIGSEENRSMMEEYLSEESFCNDPNDPDWRLTPLHKQNKRSKLERKAILNAASKKDGSGKSQDSEDSSPPDSETLLKRSFTPCQCLGECKTMRCGCKKRRVMCSDSCSCDKAHCLNLEKYIESSDEN